MQPIGIKSSIPTLRPGDVITKMACDVCVDRKVLILERHQTDVSFDFSIRSTKLNIMKDPDGPFRWDASRDTFVNKNGRPYDHINKNSIVIPNGGLKEAGWYADLPKVGDAPFIIDNSNLNRSMTEAELAKLEAIVARSFTTGKSPELVGIGMQQAFSIALGTQIEPEQMRRVLKVMDRYISQTVDLAQSAAHTNPFEGVLGAIFQSLGSGDFEIFAQSGDVRARRTREMHN